MIDITFIVSCLNEEKYVIPSIEKIILASTQLQLKYEIIVFDDASTDSTVSVINQYMQMHPNLPIRFIQNAVNKNIAYNFVEGAFQGTGKYCRLIPSEDGFTLENHLEVLKLLGTADIIIPYYTSLTGKGIFREIISKLFTLIVNFLSKNSIKYYNGRSLYLRSDVLRWHVESIGFGFEAELIIRLLQQGRSFKETPVTGLHRPGSSAFKIKNILSVTFSIFKIAMSRAFFSTSIKDIRWPDC